MTLQAIQEAYQRGDLVTVRQLVEDGLRTDPNSEQLWAIKMMTAEHMFEREAAMQRVLALNPQNPQALQFQQMLAQQKPQAAAPEASPPQMGQLPASKPDESAKPPMQPSATKPPASAEVSKPPMGQPPQKKTSDEPVYEMLWDCEFCGTTGLLGLTHRFCPHCGAQQNPSKRYFPSDEEKVAVVDHVYHGVDVTCTACETLNSANADYCMNCGAPLSEGAKATVLAAEARAEGEKFTRGQAHDLVKDKFAAEQNQIQAPTIKAKNRSRTMMILGAVFACIALCCSAAGYMYFSTDEVGVTVTGHTWEREIRIENYAAHSESDWCESLPSGFYDKRESNRNRTRQVQDGETCTTKRIDNGDGTFKEVQECTPKYRNETYTDQWCEYKVNRWDFARNLTSNGNSLAAAPYWESFSPAKTGNTLGAEREAGRTETYTVTFKDNASGKTYKCDFDNVGRWSEFAESSTWSLEIGSVLGEARCDSLKPK